MDAKEWEARLHWEGFAHTFVWQDGPNVFYPDHTHGAITAHVILEGEMTLILQGRTQTLRAGDRFDVTAETVHSARMGPAGCRYVVGEKRH